MDLNNTSIRLRCWILTYVLGLLVSIFLHYHILNVPEGKELFYAFVSNTITYITLIYWETRST